MQTSKEGHNSAMISPTEKIRFRLFVKLGPYIKFQDPIPNRSSPYADGRADRPKPICPFNFFRSMGLERLNVVNVLD